MRAAGDAIEEQAWQPIPYWLSTPEVSGADVAGTSYTAFTGRDALPVRLIVRRTRPTPRLATGAVHHLELSRSRHRPGRQDSRARSRPPPARRR